MKFIESLTQTVSVVKSCIPPFLSVALHTNLTSVCCTQQSLIVQFHFPAVLVSKSYPGDAIPLNSVTKQILLPLCLDFKANSFVSNQTNCSQDTLIPSMYFQHMLNNARFFSHKQIPTSATVLSPVLSGSSQPRQDPRESFHFTHSSQWMPPSAFRWLNNLCVGSENIHQILQLLTWDNFSSLLHQPWPTVIDLL